MRNNYRVENGTVFIELEYKSNNYETKISLNKLEKLLSLDVKWGVAYNKSTNQMYAISGAWENGKTRTRYLHRFLTDAPKGKVVDHKNHDTLDNTDQNLVICTVAENLQNMKSAKKNSKSGVIGVFKESYTGKWRATITINRKDIRSGRFENIEDAIKARKQLEAMYFKHLVEIS